MRYFIIITVAAILFCHSSFSYSNNYQKEKAIESLNQKSEVYLSFDRSLLSNNLLHALSIDYVDNNIVYAYANKYSFEVLVRENIDFKVEKHPGDVDFDLNMKSWDELLDINTRNSWDYYPTYEAYVNMMYQFEEDFPELCSIHNIGSTVMNRDLLFARITSNVNQDQPKTLFMYTSTMHGDETTGFILLLRLIDHFLNNYGEDDEITELLDNMEIWICPNENPDGTYTNNNNTVSGATRGNANGIDLNRNYPNPVDQHFTQQPETIAMMEFVSDKNFVMSANMHGGIELVNYPWDSWTSSAKPHADHDWWDFVSREYADTAQYYSPHGYMTSMYNGITHGGDWYVVWGSRQDYMNYYRSIRELTLELSNEKLLNPSSLPAHWNYNYRSMINYIKQARYGVHGVATNEETGEPVPVKVTVTGHDKDNSEVYACDEFGYFARPLLAGTYNFQFSKYGYDIVTINNVSVTNHQTTWLDVEIKEWPINIAEVNSTFEMYVSPNPLSPYSKLVINGTQSKEMKIVVYNSMGVMISQIYNGTIDNSVEISLSDIYKTAKPGVYIIKAIGKNVATAKILVL